MAREFFTPFEVYVGQTVWAKWYENQDTGVRCIVIKTHGSLVKIENVYRRVHRWDNLANLLVEKT